MAKGRMTKIMCQSKSLRDIFIKPERAGNAAANLRDFNGMGQSGPIIIAYMVNKNLRFMF
jgi:hypothetical protein